MANFFQPVSVGSPTRPASIAAPQSGILSGDSQLTRQAEELHRRNMARKPRQEEERNSSSNNNFNRDQFQNKAPTNTTTGTAPQPTGSSLVAGGPGTGLAASYAPSFGLQGAVSSGGLGSYAGGAGGLMTASGGGASAGTFSGLGAASSGLTYGGATGAATTSAGASGWGSLAGASSGLTFGGGGAAAGGAASGAAAGGSAAAGAGGAAGASGMSAIFSNPWTAIGAAIVGAANYQHNKGISSWSDTLKGKGGGEISDYFGRKDDQGNTKGGGILSKIGNQDKSVGKSVKGFTDLSELDFKNAWKNGSGAIKDLFKGKII